MKKRVSRSDARLLIELGSIIEEADSDSFQDQASNLSIATPERVAERRPKRDEPNSDKLSDLYTKNSQESEEVKTEAKFEHDYTYLFEDNGFESIDDLLKS